MKSKNTVEVKFRITKQLSQNETGRFAYNKTISRETSLNRFKLKALNEMAQVKPQHFEPSMGIEVYASICLPFVVGFILSV